MEYKRMEDLLETLKRDVLDDAWSLTTFAMTLSDELYGSTFELNNEDYSDFYFMLRNGGEL